RFYSVEGSALQVRRLREFYAAWRRRLEQMPFDGLGMEGRGDWPLLARPGEREMAPLVPFAADVARLQEARRLMEPVDPQAAAAALERMAKQVGEMMDGLQAGLKDEG